MPRTRRYIFNTLTVVSLLLMLGAVGLWVDRYWHVASVGFVTQDKLHHYQLVSKHSGVLIGHYESRLRSGFFFFGDSRAYLTHTGLPSVGPSRPSFYVLEHKLIVPHWFLTLIFAILPAIWFIKWRKRIKLRPNSCPSCAYDLTGNVTGQCPECGATLNLSEKTHS